MSVDASSAIQPLPIVVGGEEARRTVLRRRPLDDECLSAGESAVVEHLFGEPLDAGEAVRRILRDVREGGDAALLQIAKTIDGFVDELVVQPHEFEAARSLVDAETVRALQLAAERVRGYHERQLEHSLRSFDSDGIGQIVRPLRRVGLYVPGTTAV